MGKLEDIAKNIAEKWHKGQYRKDNKTPYIVHPKNVVKLLKLWGVDNDEQFAVAWMHDLLEDTEISKNDILKIFGSKVLKDIEILSNDKTKDKQEWLNDLADKAEDYIIIIKMADRISNVYDFLNSGNTKYAEEYLHKADKIIRKLKKNKSVISQKVQKSVKKLKDYFDKLKKSKIASNIVAGRIKYDGYDGGSGKYRIFFIIGDKVYGYETWDKALVDDVEYMSKTKKQPGKALNMVKSLPFKKYKKQ